MYFNVNVNVLFKLIKVALLVNELYITLHASEPYPRQINQFNIFKPHFLQIG